jgi:toxin-antitoxin system PIN domain toxin
MKSLIFPDVNVWLALNYEKHIHSSAAVQWYESVDPVPTLVFCRHTQLGLFRLLSTDLVMKQDALSQARCWEIYDRWVDSDRAFFGLEPSGLEAALRTKTSAEKITTKAWADAYLAAFAETAGLRLVTFDRALAGKATGAVLLS